MKVEKHSENQTIAALAGLRKEISGAAGKAPLSAA
jgi:hypothetical protein